MARNPKPLRIWKARYCRYLRRCGATLGRELGPQDVVGLEFPGPLTSEEISIYRSGGLDPDPRSQQDSQPKSQKLYRTRPTAAPSPSSTTKR